MIFRYNYRRVAINSSNDCSYMYCTVYWFLDTVLSVLYGVCKYARYCTCAYIFLVCHQMYKKTTWMCSVFASVYKSCVQVFTICTYYRSPCSSSVSHQIFTSIIYRCMKYVVENVQKCAWDVSFNLRRKLVFIFHNK